MYYVALACDYDGTLARNGVVSEKTVEALTRVRESGRSLILVTGRELNDLKQVFSHLNLFDFVVSENGASLFQPQEGTELVLGEPPAPEFIRALKERKVEPLSVGKVIVATWQPNETIVLEAIRDLGLELQVIFNKGAVMVLPTGINKASGLSAALLELGLSPHNNVGIGDAENDHAFLSLCECGVAVANALPTVKERADFVTRGDHGAGVIELIDNLLSTDLSDFHLTRHSIVVGTAEDGKDVTLDPHGGNVLVAGTSQGGKTTLTTGPIERLSDRGYQVCVIDPEGDYSTLESAVILGSEQGAPTADEVVELLARPDENIVVNLLGIALNDRPTFFTGLLSRLLELRSRKGRPHWIVIDEAHHLLPSAFEPAMTALPMEISGLMMITVEPSSMSISVLSTIDTIIATGDSPVATIQDFCREIGERLPTLAPTTLERGEALLWSRGYELGPIRFQSAPPRTERRRHQRKYAEGELPPDRSFYFRGPQNRLNLRAQNLVLFLQMADGVDDETWLHHLRRGEYSKWFREEIHDEELAEEVARIEQSENLQAQASREAIKAAVEQRYTSPV